MEIVIATIFGILSVGLLWIGIIHVLNDLSKPKEWEGKNKEDT